MREYVLFVILIFIPIGLALHYFLRREGLPNKDTYIVLILALVIIFTFPISMARLGIYVSMLIYLLVISALVCYLLYPGESRYLEKAFASLRTLRIRADGKEEPDLSGLTYEEATNLLLGSLENTARELLGPAPNASPSQGAEPDLADELPVAEGQDVSAEQSQAVAMSEPTTEITVLDTEAEDAALDIMETEVSSEKPLAELEQDGAFDEPLSQVAEERGDSTEDITAEGIGETLTEESAAAAAEADSAEENDVWVADEIDNNISEAVLVEATDILSEETWALRPDSAEGTTGEALEPVQVGEPYEAAAEIHEISEELEAGPAEATAVDIPAASEYIETAMVEVPPAEREPEESHEVAAVEMIEMEEEFEASEAAEPVEEIEAAPGEGQTKPDETDLPDEPGGESIEVTAIDTGETEEEIELHSDLEEPAEFNMAKDAEQAGAENGLPNEAMEEPDSPGEESIEVTAIDTGETEEEIELYSDLEEPAEFNMAKDAEQAGSENDLPDEAMEESELPGAETTADAHGEQADAEVELEARPMEEDIEQTIETEIFEEIIAEEDKANLQDDNEAIVDDTPAGMSAMDMADQFQSAAEPEHENTEEAAVSPEETVEPAETDQIMTVDDESVGQAADIQVIEENDFNTVEEISAEALEEEYREELPEEAITDVALEDTIIEISSVNENDEPETEEETALLIEATIEDEESRQIMLQADTTDSGLKRVDVLRWVDEGFRCKAMPDLPAAIYAFVQAWNGVENDELKYLITLELVELYKECGYYNYAEQVLGNYLELGGHKSDIIYEINRQLDAVRFLATELTRLGMSGAPWAQVPRWIRMELENALTSKS